MRAYKAIYLANCSHRIEPLECEKLTHDVVVINRSADEISRNHNTAPVIFQRETKHERYCASIDEAVDFLDAKYQEKIENLGGVIFNLKQKQKSLINEVAA